MKFYAKELKKKSLNILMNYQYQVILKKRIKIKKQMIKIKIQMNLHQVNQKTKKSTFML